ncbi:MAG: asparagine synthase (glutamine-hydrolyzing), partial [Terriglobia bacterium]
MCGIAGIVGEVQSGDIRQMTRTLAHRGPDGEGYFYSKHAQLGHRRLSVVDLQTGGQPMTTAEGRYTIVFNGEIYNYRDLKRTLESQGVRFRTHSDTEVLLEAYARWGRAAVEKLRGAFAFAVWDEGERRLFAARDRLGIRPFYYTQVGETLLFASEMKALLVHPAVKRELNYAALDDYLSYLYVPAPHTIFKNISELLPAHQIEWREGRIQSEPYWDVTFQPGDRNFRECAEDLSQSLSEAVEIRLESDVPLGVFLSGGLDSSAVAALMARQLQGRVKTFTLGFAEGGKHYDERLYARQVGEALEADACEQTIQAGSAGLLSTVTRHFDEPFGNPTSLLTYGLSEAGKRRLTVALTGDGGDEVLLGYPRYRGVMLAEWYRKTPELLRRIAATGAAYWSEPANGNHFRRRLREFLTASSLSPEQMYVDWVSYFPGSLRRRLYSPELSHQLGDYDSSHFLLDLFKRSGPGDFVDRVNYVDLHSFLPYNILRCSDRMSMANGLEIRSPFTDHVLVEKLARVPWRYKLGLTRGKILLREAARGWLPKNILRRAKLGLNPPMGLWMQGRLEPLLRSYLSPGSIRRRGYFCPKVVQELISDHLAGRRDYSLHLWAL